MFRETASVLGLLAIAVVGWLTTIQPQPADPASSADSFPGNWKPCTLPGGGWLKASLHGDLTLVLNHRDERLHCEGMLRPDESGLRLMFATRAPGGAPGDRLVLVIGLDGQLAGLAGSERFANVTVIDERDGRFFGSQQRGRCFSTVRSAEPVAGTGERQWRIEGDLYCAGALPSLRDMGSLMLDSVRYAGRLEVVDD